MLKRVSKLHEVCDSLSKYIPCLKDFSTVYSLSNTFSHQVYIDILLSFNIKISNVNISVSCNSSSLHPHKTYLTGEQMSVSDALRHGFLDRGRKHFCNPHTNEVFSLDEALKNGWVLLKSNYDKSKTQAGFSFKGKLDNET